MVLVLNRKWEYIGGGGEVEGGVEEKEIVEGLFQFSLKSWWYSSVIDLIGLVT
jgi:hypothetical protein